VADHTSLKSGVNKLEINQKVEPCTGYQINLRSVAADTKNLDIDKMSILKIVASKRPNSHLKATIFEKFPFTI
jgi:hypothetical protein